MGSRNPYSDSFSTKFTRKYIQTDITSYFGNTKMEKCVTTSKKTHKNRKYKAVFSIIISDSDSDFEDPPKNVSFLNKKPKLPFPILSEDEGSDEEMKNSNAKEKMCINATSTPCKRNIESDNNKTIVATNKNVDTTIVNNKKRSSLKALGNSSSLKSNKETKRSENIPLPKSNTVKTMMQLNKPKNCDEVEKPFSDAASTSCKTSMDNDKTIDGTTQNNSGTVGDTSLLNQKSSVKILHQVTLSSPSGSKRMKEDTGEVPQTSCKKQKYDTSPLATVKQSSSFLEKHQGNKNDQTKFGSPNKEELKQNKNIPKKPLIHKSAFKQSASKPEGSTPEKVNVECKTSLMDTPHSVNAKKQLFGSSALIEKGNQITDKEMTTTGPSTPKKGKSPSKTPNDDENMKQKQEAEKRKTKLVDCIKDLFNSSLQEDDKRKLLMESEVKVIEEFLEMDVNYQYLLIKLFLYLPKWYNIRKFCITIKLDQWMSAKEIDQMYEYFKEKGFLDTDIASLELDVLLDTLSLFDLKRICDKFRLGKVTSGKNNKNNKNKSDLIELLKRNCRTQSTLSYSKSTEDLIRDAAKEQFGFCVKLKDSIKMTFTKTYLLQTFTNLLYLDPQNYMRDKLYLYVTYPDYNVEEFCPFASRDQFTCYFQAVLLKKDYHDASDKNNYVTMKNCCDDIFEKLQNITPDGKWKTYAPDYFQKFSAEYQYISVLRKASERLIRYHDSVKLWLEYLIDNYPSHHCIGFWYKQLVHIQLKYLKAHDTAAKTVIKAFEMSINSHRFNVVQMQELSTLANRIMSSKTYKVSNLYCDILAKFAELPIEDTGFPKKLITGQTDRNNKQGKRTYFYVDDNNERNFGSVEMIVLNHYQTREDYSGIHCEGRLLTTLFTILFWDIIYSYYVPNTFISKLQSAPLDMYSDSFYKNRQDEIDKRLKEVEEIWSIKEIEKVLKENWDCHSHEESITPLMVVTTKYEELLAMFKCIDRRVLSKMFERLVINFKTFQSGLPDLFLWKSDISKCKFVEVKGEGDKLSLKQKLWIQYLIDIGADVEVCYVSGVGAKTIKKTKDDECDS